MSISHREQRTASLLGVEDLRTDYRLGRDLAFKLAQTLPHVITGRAGRGERRLVRREDMDRLIAAAARVGVSLWSIVREHDAGSLAAWLEQVEAEAR